MGKEQGPCNHGWIAELLFDLPGKMSARARGLGKFVKMFQCGNAWKVKWDKSESGGVAIIG